MENMLTKFARKTHRLAVHLATERVDEKTVWKMYATISATVILGFLIKIYTS